MDTDHAIRSDADDGVGLDNFSEVSQHTLKVGLVQHSEAVCQVQE